MSTYAHPAHYATQRAWWRSADGLAAAAVNATTHRDSRGATGWTVELTFPTGPNTSVHHTIADPANLIYGWGDSREMLETLAGFLTAWEEAQRYPNNENRDLFPASCAPFIPYAEEMACDTMTEEGD